MLILSEQASKKPGLFLGMAGILSILFITLVLLPSLWPQQFSFLHPLQVDTDPENMLSEDEPVRQYHNKMKAAYGLYDMVVVGVVNDNHQQGVFNQQTLKNIYELTQFAQTLQWSEDGKDIGVIDVDLIAPSTVDNIQQAGMGAVQFEWLMASPPESDEEAAEIATKASRIPFLKDTLISGDNKALALYVPITAKNLSYRVSKALQEKINSFNGEEQYYITGMAVAQDYFGVEMFQQMAISAPLAMLVIFILLWIFFRQVKLITSPLLVAVVAVILTMGLAISTGHTVHIMTSMIPIFIMPIAVLDSVHILSDFFDRYPKTRDRYQTIKVVMEELSAPMMFTSLTTSVAFLSLALTPIPPVRVFGIFVGIGVLLAWLLTVTLIPAFIMRLSDKSLADFGLKHSADSTEHSSKIGAFMHWLGRFSYNQAKLIVVVTILLGGVAYYGITKIVINDNPVKWFSTQHDIRIADKVMNERFAGTYMGYLSLEVPAGSKAASPIDSLSSSLSEIDTDISKQLIQHAEILLAQQLSLTQLYKQLNDFAVTQQELADSDEVWDEWDAGLTALSAIESAQEVFKQPEVLKYIESLQTYLLTTGYVGKSNALPDIIKTVYRELLLGEEEAFVIPGSSSAVAQTLITYESSHRPQDLWHFVTPDFRNANIWIQLKSGDNQDMTAVVEAVDKYIAENPPPHNIEAHWFGLTYINVVWQQKMVTGMLTAFMGSFVVVLVMMAFLFRSIWWGVLSMVPLTITIAMTYGVIGLIGKNYDMPIAILSSLSLGLAVDYAIHFLARSRYYSQFHSSWKETLEDVFGEPARAIFRNIIIIGCGFLPLLLAPLVPYQTVGVFISSILFLAGAASLVLLPALMRLFERQLFKSTSSK